MAKKLTPEEKIKKIEEKLKKGKTLTKSEKEFVLKYFKEKQKSPLKGKLPEKDIKAINTYIGAILRHFEKYIKAVVVWGSNVTGKGKKSGSDIDLAVIVDDTDVRTMTRVEVKERLFQKLVEAAYPISKKYKSRTLHPQPYLLTEFWEMIREGNPVIFNVLRDGIVLYDTGFFLPIQMLFKAGMIYPSKEAVDKHINIANRLIKSVEDEIKFQMVRALDQAVVSSAQAVLMELGYRPPTPNEVPSFVERFLMKEYKLVNKSAVDIAKDVHTFYKKVEHGDIKKVDAKTFFDYKEKAKKFVELMTKLLKDIRKKKGESYMFEIAEKERGVSKEKVIKPREDKIVEFETKKHEDINHIIEDELGQR